MNRSFLKILIIVTLAIFLISTGLMSVMYLSGGNKTANSDQQTGDVIGTGTDTGNIN